MAGSFLTPTSLWGDFAITEKAYAETIEEYSKNGIDCKRQYIAGADYNDGQVKIYTEFRKQSDAKTVPAVILVEGLGEKIDDEYVLWLTKQGYATVVVDITGKTEGAKDFTFYPNSVNYAEYERVKDNLYTVGEDVKKSCWYVWSVVLRYVTHYLKERSDISKIGALSYGEVANVLWTLASSGELSASVMIDNTGWKGYKGINKFENQTVEHFSDSMYKFMAGIDPIAYSQHVNCSTLCVCSTNSTINDCDRAYDTVVRIPDDVNKMLYYAVNSDSCIDTFAIKNIELFFKSQLKGEGEFKTLDPDIKCDLVNGEIKIEVFSDSEDVENVYVYCSEQSEDPKYRSWGKLSASGVKNGVYRFIHNPYSKSGICFYFATVELKDGYTLCSKIISKKFEEGQVKLVHKSNIVYSSRKENAESVFSSYNNGVSLLRNGSLISDSNVTVKRGPSGFEGVTSRGGLLSFKINALKDKPKDYPILMLDVYSKNQAEFCVSLVVDYFGKSQKYTAKINLSGANVWKNVKFELNNFKTEEGLPLKKLNDVNAIIINSDSEYLVNNILWI